jgi:hypothetical protein
MSSLRPDADRRTTNVTTAAGRQSHRSRTAGSRLSIGGEEHAHPGVDEVLEVGRGELRGVVASAILFGLVAALAARLMRGLPDAAGTSGTGSGPHHGVTHLTYRVMK